MIIHNTRRELLGGELGGKGGYTGRRQGNPYRTLGFPCRRSRKCLASARRYKHAYDLVEYITWRAASSSAQRANLERRGEANSIRIVRLQFYCSLDLHGEEASPGRTSTSPALERSRL